MNRKIHKIPRLHVVTRGNGPVVVLLHGFLSTSHYWTKVMNDLSADHTVIAMDLLGFGQSPKPSFGRYDYDHHIKSILVTLDAIGVTQPVTFVGHSMGSLLALRLSIVNPERVKKLVTVNPPIMIGKKQVTSEIYGTSALYRHGLQPMTHRLIWPLFRMLYKFNALPSKTLQWIRRSPYIFEHSATSRIRSFRNIIMKSSVEQDLPIVSVPTVILSGSQDRPVYLKNLRNHVSFSPSVIEQQIITTGHHIPLVFPQMVTAAIRMGK